MDSWGMLVANAVVDLLAGGTFATPIDLIEKDYAPDHELKSDSGIIVSVAPMKQKIQLDEGSRCGNDYAISLDVAIRKKLPGKTKSEWTPQVDEMLGLVTEIQAFLGENASSLDIGGGNAVRLADIDDEPLYDPNSLRTRRLFISVLSLNYILEQ